MGEYIRKNDVIEVLIKTIVPPSITLDTLIQRIDNIPRADVRCVRHGKWIGGFCSICGCDVPAYIIDWKWQKDMDAKYCPICGAQMDEK